MSRDTKNAGLALIWTVVIVSTFAGMLPAVFGV